jgi:hypothetical protein
MPDGVTVGDVTMLPCSLEPPSPARPPAASTQPGARYSLQPSGAAPVESPLVGQSWLASSAAANTMASTRLLSPAPLAPAGELIDRACCAYARQCRPLRWLSRGARWRVSGLAARPSPLVCTRLLARPRTVAPGAPALVGPPGRVAVRGATRLSVLSRDPVLVCVVRTEPPHAKEPQHAPSIECALPARCTRTALLSRARALCAYRSRRRVLPTDRPTRVLVA